MFNDGAIISNSVTVLTLITIAFSLFKNARCAVALIVSLGAAKYLTYIDADALHVHVLFICSAICITTYESGSKWFFKSLDIEDNEVNYAVSFLYMIRMVVAIGCMVGLYSTVIMWLVSMFFLVIQLLLILGGCIDGFSIRFNERICHYRIAAHNHVFMAKRHHH